MHVKWIGVCFVWPRGGSTVPSSCPCLALFPHNDCDSTSKRCTWLIFLGCNSKITVFTPPQPSSWKNKCESFLWQRSCVDNLCRCVFLTIKWHCFALFSDHLSFFLSACRLSCHKKCEVKVRQRASFTPNHMTPWPRFPLTSYFHFFSS